LSASEPFRPPARAGVGASCVGLSPGPYAHVLDFLLARFPQVSRQTWLDRLSRGDVINDQGQALSLAQALQSPYLAQGRLYYFREVPQEAAIAAQEQVLYQDEHLLVVDKPHGLPVVPSGAYLAETVLVRQKKRLGLDTLVPIHRIDRDTAGLVMFSLQAPSRAAYAALFSQREIQKTYEAIAPWRADLAFPLRRASRIVPGPHFMLQQEVQGTVNAITDIDILEQQGELGRYRLRPITGRRHQLRVHMLGLGLPLLNDGLYPVLTPESHMQAGGPLQLLAKTLAFTCPVTGQQHHFESTLSLLPLSTWSD
jgi:tRNA pseudouridine32 synthase/23S rRNA pseudouridine746 synthase